MKRPARLRTAFLAIAAGVGLVALAASASSTADLIKRAQQLIQQGKFPEAQSELEEAIKQFPKEAGLYDLLGVVEAQEKNYRAAEASFARAIELDGRLAGAHLNLGRLYQENPDKLDRAAEKALKIYEHLLAFDPKNTEANYQSAVLLERRGAFRSSLERLAHLPEEARNRPQALAVRVADFIGLGDHRQADQASGRLLASPELSEADVLLALPELARGKQDALAIRLLEGIAGRGLASPGSMYQLGVLYERGAQYDQARQALEKAATAKLNSAQPLIELARVANSQQDYRAALGYLAHARDLEPANASVHFFFGMVCVELNLAQEADASLQRAVQLNPQNPYYNYALGAVAAERDDPREALPYIRKYCELKPRDPRGRFALGAAYYYSRDYDAAAKELRAVAGLSRTAAGAHYFLGRIAVQEGRLPEAVNELEKALKQNPRYADALAELGHVRLNQKEYQRAEEALVRAIQIDSDNYTANFNLMVLYQRTTNSRAEAQAKRFDEVRKKREERAKEFLRTIEVRP